MSHPTWVRGLKCSKGRVVNDGLRVAPHMGAWIEIGSYNSLRQTFKVAPHMGAWIEMDVSAIDMYDNLVAPHMGAWIEINLCHV